MLTSADLSALWVTDKELHILHTSGELNCSVQRKSSLTHSSEQKSKKPYLLWHWKFPPKNKHECFMLVWFCIGFKEGWYFCVTSGKVCLGIKNDTITRNEQKCPVNMLKTIIFRDYIETVCKKSWDHLLSPSFTDMKNNRRTRSSYKRDDYPANTAAFLWGDINPGQISRSPTQCFHSDMHYPFLCIPGAYLSLVRWSYAPLTHNKQMTRCCICSFQCTQWKSSFLTSRSNNVWYAINHCGG